MLYEWTLRDVVLQFSAGTPARIPHNSELGSTHTHSRANPPPPSTLSHFRTRVLAVSTIGESLYQQSDLSSSTSCCVSLPVSADGSSSRARSWSCGDVRCVMLLGARIADTGSVKCPASGLGLGLPGTS